MPIEDGLRIFGGRFFIPALHIADGICYAEGNVCVPYQRRYAVRIDFEWDSNKARLNAKKHGVSFELAATVFHDPRAVSVFDESHSRQEDRWLTLGVASNGGLLVVHHTFDGTDENRARVRIISSRRATKNETAQYGE